MTTVKTTTLNNLTTNSGTYLISSSNGATWSDPNTHFTSGGINNKTLMSIPYNSDEVVIEPEAALNVKGKVIINGENLGDRLDRIETLLNIPTRDIEIENEFPRLKTLWKEYSEELEKYKTWKRINT